MKKILLICTLLLAIVLSFAACGGNNNPPSNNEGSNNETPHTHSFSEWDVTVKPTCTENGTKVRYCSCGEKQSEIAASIGHTPADAVIEDKIEATYEADGSYNEIVRCSTCGEKLSETSHTIPMLKHTPAEAVTENVVDATCYSEGSYDEVVYCSVENCKVEISRTTKTINALGHTEVVDEAIAPTCTETGLTEGKHCSVCDEVLVAQETVEALGHTEVIDNAVAPTCTETGLTEGKHCSVCNVILVAQQTIDALEHNYVDKICTVCGDKYYSKGLEYTQNGDGTCSVSGIGTCNDTDIVIPSAYNGMTVTGILSRAFYNCSTITSIEVPDTIVNVGKNAFDGCSKLRYNKYDNANYIGNDENPYLVLVKYENTYFTNLKINDKTKIIASYAFYYCPYITSIAIPDSVTHINSGAFYYCFVLTDIVIGNNVISIGAYAFEKTGIETITIPDSVTYLGDSAFRSCHYLSDVVIGNGINTIEEFSFSSCESLKNVKLGIGIEKIGMQAFRGCTALEIITIPKSVTYIDYFAFAECQSLDIVCYDGTMADWQSIHKHSMWNQQIGDCILRCTDDDIDISNYDLPLE